MDRDPSHIMQVGMGFWPSKTLLSAVELELFTQLGSESMTGEELRERLGLHERGDLRLPRHAGRPRAARARRRRHRWPLPQHPGRRGLPGQEQPRLRRRDPRDVERAPVPVLGRPHRGAPDRQAPERGEAHRQADVRGALQRPGAARAVHGRDGGDLARQLPGAGRQVRLLAGTRRSATSAARPASCARSWPRATRTCAARATTCRSSCRSPRRRSRPRGSATA